MAGITIKIEGLDKALKRFLPEKYEPQIQKCFNDFGDNVEREAKLLAPVDEGILRSSIFSTPKKLGTEVGASVEYAAYLEFGTRKFAAAYVAGLPPTWQELAATTKGSNGGGGSFEKFVMVLTEWVKRKGFAAQITAGGNKSKSKSSEAAQRQAAYLIARKILREGIKPHPFLYPAITGQTDGLIKALNKIKL